jgi:hypothetical protein
MILALDVVESVSSTRKNGGSFAGPGLASNPQYNVLIMMEGMSSSSPGIKPLSVSHSYEEFEELQRRLAEKYPEYYSRITAEFPRRLRRNSVGIPASGHQAEVRCFKLHKVRLRMCVYIRTLLYYKFASAYVVLTHLI